MKIDVGSRLVITEPTDAVLEYCRTRLVLDNPEYYKKERMGLFLGDTPRNLRLYETVGEGLWLPFGCLRDIWKMHPVADDYTTDFADFKAMEYESHIDLYPYQQTAVEKAIKAKNGVLVMPCGGGKTMVGLELIARIGGRALWLTHTQDLLSQSMERANAVLDVVNGRNGTITAGKIEIGTHITFATVQTMAKKIDTALFRDCWDVIIVDECMPGETMIDVPDGKKELKYLRNGDIITSYNRNTEKLENKRVTHVFKNKAHDIVKVKLSNGEEIVCTGNHPIFTKNGQWIDAERLVQNDYVLRLVWKTGRDRYDAKNIQTQSVKKGLLLLFKGMLNKRRSHKKCVDRRTPENCIGNYEQNKSKISRSDCGAYDYKESDEKCRCEESGIKQAERNRASSKNKMWKRNGADCATTDVNACACSRECRGLCRVSDTDKDAERFGISNLLQGRYSVNRSNAGNRGRRKLTLCNRKTKTGSEKRAVFEWVRVESVEIQQQTGDGTFGGLCSDGYVYNIEVEDNNNYFADGILVHNCHHAAGTPTKLTQFYKVISRLAARYKIGLTATPKRADGLEQSMFYLLGDTIHEVSREEVAHTTCPIKVQKIETGWIPEYDCILMGDGTIDYNKVIDAMIHDESRYHIVFGDILLLRGATMVLANRVEYLQKMCDDLVGCGKRAICLSGQGQSKKAKAERKAALQALNNGELDCVFCTFQLAKEGLDVPNLRYVVFVTPEQNESTVIQAVGRVGRKADGKEYGTVIDFVDDFGMYREWYKKRVRYYKKIDAEIKE